MTTETQTETKPGENKQEEKTFEIPVKETPKEPEKMTEEKALADGWSNEEIELAKETGMLHGPKDEKKEETPPKEEPKSEVKKEEPHTEIKPTGEDYLLSPEEEKRLAEVFDKNPDTPRKLKNVTANYWGRKHATARAQAAEAERDRLLRELGEQKERIAKLEQGTVKPEEPTEEDEKPLTKKELRDMLKTMQEDETTARKKQQEQSQVQERKIREALTIHESHAKNVYQDFEQVVGLGERLVRRDPKTGEFSSPVNITNIPEQARKKAFVLLRQIQSAALRADEMTVSDYTVADMSYDLGKLASEFIKDETQPATEPNTPTGQTTERTSGGLTPEEEERIRKNQHRAGSSASISGSGGRRVLSIDEVTLDDLNAMDSKTFDAFQQKYPDKVEALMRE